MWLTRVALERRRSTVAVVAVLVVLGVYGLAGLPVDFLPNVTYPLIKVHIWWRGATPEEIEQSIADPIERQMATVDDLDYLQSSSIEGMYTLEANFRYGTDVDVAYQDALAAMARVARELPADMDPPVVIKADPSQLPVVQMTISSDQWDLVQLRTWADEWLQDQLLAVPGVAGTEIVGGLKREIRVHLDPAALEKYGLTPGLIAQRLREENVEQFGGRVTTGPKEIIARTTGEYQDLEAIRNVVLRRSPAGNVYLRHVAAVEDAHEETRVITRLGGRPCVKLSVLKQASANTVAVAEAVSARIAELTPDLPTGLRLGLVENQADYVGAALHGVQNAALEAAVLVVVIIYLFLGSWRQIVVLATALPLTLVINFGVMKLAGFSLNIFSLGGLVIAMGVLLDNSIVVIENITRRQETSTGSSAADVALDGAAEVGSALVAATVSLLALFVPFLIVPGLTSLLFRELILVIAGIVAISLAIAVTVTAMLTAGLFERQVRGSHAGGRFERFFTRLTRAYGEHLTRLLGQPWRVVAVFLATLVGGGLLVNQLGSEFLPQMDDGRVMVKLKLPTGASLGETDRVLAQAEQKLLDDPRIESMFTLAGGKVWGLYTYEIANEGELNLQLVPREQRDITTKQYVESLRPVLSKIPVPGGKLMVSQMKVKGIRKLGDADIDIEFRGNDLRVLDGLARRTSATLNELGAVTNVSLSSDLSKPEYQVVVDRAKAAAYGVAVGEVAETLRTLLTGAVATRYRDRNEYYGIRLVLPESRLDSRQAIENLPVTGAAGRRLRIRDVAEVVRSTGPVELVRRNQVKQVVVSCDAAAGRSVGEALTAVRAALDTIDRPPGYAYTFGGQATMMAEMARTIGAVMLFALFFSFVVLTVQFNSYRLPALILLGVPFSLTGMAAALWATQLPLGATVAIGVLVVVAATINDGVLLLDFAETIQHRESVAPVKAVVEAATIRLRPRLMTTVSTLVGFLPLALALEAGGDMLQPMAAAAIGGLLMEIPVALYLMPCLYVLVQERGRRQPSREATPTSQV